MAALCLPLAGLPRAHFWALIILLCVFLAPKTPHSYPWSRLLPAALNLFIELPLVIKTQLSASTPNLIHSKWNMNLPTPPRGSSPSLP